MAIYAKVRAGFSAVVGEMVHEGGVMIAVTEAEFKAIAHKVEELPEEIARLLHLTKGHALAISPAVAQAQGLVEAQEQPAVSSAAAVATTGYIQAVNASVSEAATPTEPPQAAPETTSAPEPLPQTVEASQAEAALEPEIKEGA